MIRALTRKTSIFHKPIFHVCTRNTETFSEALFGVRYATSFIDKNELLRRSEAAVMAALTVKKALSSKYSNSSPVHSYSLARTLERLDKLHDLDVSEFNQRTEEIKFDIETVTYYDDHFVSDAPITNNSIENEVDSIYKLTKTKQPPLPEKNVVLNWYKCTLEELKQFSRSRRIPVRSTKLATFKEIIYQYKLPAGTVYITDEDLNKRGISLSCRELYSTPINKALTNQKNYSIHIRYPTSPVVDGCLPISHFFYIDSEKSAEAAIALLTDKSLQWHISKQIYDERSFPSLGPPSSDTTNHIELENHIIDNKNENSNIPFSEIHPRLNYFEKCPCLSLHPSYSMVGVDVETTGLDPLKSELRDYPTFVIDIFKLKTLSSTSDFSTTSSKEFLNLIQKILESSTITKVFYNGKFDYKFLYHHLKIAVAQPISDLMLSASLLEAGRYIGDRTFGLAALTQNQLKFNLSLKNAFPWVVDKGWNNDYLTNDQLLYACRDAAVLPYIHSQINVALNAAQLTQVNELESRCLPPVAQIELNGINFDKERWDKLTHIIEGDIFQYEHILREKLGWNTKENTNNIDSPKQILEALRELNVTIPISRQTERRINCDTRNSHNLSGNLITKTDIKTLMSVKNEYEQVEAVIRYRKSKKLLTGFIKSIPDTVNPITGRIYCNLNQLGAASGRFSCDSPNLQQIPRDPIFRSCFLPTPGYCFVVADFSQIELRIAADLAPDFAMIDAFSKGEDLHVITASLLRNIDKSEVTKADRQLAKAVNFGLIYGISAKGLQEYSLSSYGVPLTLLEATSFRKAFFSHYIGIAAWHQRVSHGINRDSTDVLDVPECQVVTRSRSNRRALFCTGAGRLSHLLNYPVQGTSADIIKESLSMLFEEKALDNIGGKILLCVHDELVVEVPKDSAEEGLRVIKDTMERAGAKYFCHVECVANGSIGDNWSCKT